MQNRTKYQEKIIKSYYRNLDAIKLQSLQELVSKLYLAENEKTRARLWQQVTTSLEQLELPASRIGQIIDKKNLEQLARLVTELFGKG